jgi:HrpA-like RNA helicase
MSLDTANFLLYNTSSSSSSSLLKNQESVVVVPELPIAQYQSEIIASVRDHRTLIIVSQTGSGKTTQIPKYLLSSSVLNGKRIAVTQPRRVAAVTVAQRVSQELGGNVGEVVGYNVRFDCKVSKATRIKYLTDGMLLREALVDRFLDEYGIIVLDEAHERTTNTDVLFALLKDLQKTKRTNLRIVIMSATLQIAHFAKYFFFAGGNIAPGKIMQIPGRTFPVQIFYTDVPQKDYIDAAVRTIYQIHSENLEVSGDILVFLTGQDDIESSVAMLKEANINFVTIRQPALNILPFYAALPQEQQMKVFKPSSDGARKVVLATNIAETSLTIPGIKFVVDCGLSKKKLFAPSTGVDMLISVPISRAEGWQRSGRAGREQPGICYRLYTEQTFDELSENIVPEILRSNLSIVALQLKSLGIENILSFDFIDRPPLESLKYAIEDIFSLGCLDEEGDLTLLGKDLAKLPIDPKFGKALLCAKNANCLTEMLSIISLLSVESLYFVPRDDEQKEQFNSSRIRFSSVYGDHISLLNFYNASEGAKFEKKWCKDNFVHHRSLLKAIDIRNQLEEYMRNINSKVSSMPLITGDALEITIRKCLLAGLFNNLARRQPDGSYKTLSRNQIVYIHPSSILFGKKPPMILYTELVLTSKQYVRGLSVIDQEWIAQIIPNMFDPNQM